MARGAEACAAMVARADLRLAEAAVPDRPRHADISRSDLSQSLCSDARRAEEGADGTVAYKAADASRQRRQGQEWTGAHTRYGLYPRPTRRGRGSRSSWPLGRRSSTGASDTHIVTLVERHSRFTMLVKLPRKDTTTVVAALAKHIRKLPEQLRRSLTWDQGKEMSGHKRFTVATNVQVYFCDPRSPWQRGSNENTNGLLRQYFPRGTDLSRFSQAYLNGIALRLNQRPRKTLAFETPANRLQLVLRRSVEITPQKRTSLMRSGTSDLCQKETSRQSASARRAIKTKRRVSLTPQSTKK